MSNHINFRQSKLQSKEIYLDKKEHYIMINGSIVQEGLIILNMYAPRVSKYETKTDREAMKNRCIHYYSWRLWHPSVRNGQFSRQKISKDIGEFNSTINLLCITNIYRLLHPIAADHPFFSRTHSIFTKIEHILGHKNTLTNF